MAMASSSMDEDMESTPRTGDECLDELNSTAEAEVNGPDMNEANATEEEMKIGSQPQHALALAQVEETEDAVADNVQVGGLAQHQSHGDLTDISPLSEEDADDKEEDRQYSSTKHISSNIRGMTISSVINANNTAIGRPDSIHSHRANVDRLLMSGGSLGRGGRGGSSMECGGGSDDLELSSHRHLPQHHRGSHTSYASRTHSHASLSNRTQEPHIYPNNHIHYRLTEPYQHNVAHTYDQNYYRSVGDWLRFVRRRDAPPAPSCTLSGPQFDGGHSSHQQQHYHPNDVNNKSGGYVHQGVSVPGYGQHRQKLIDPDGYYRRFDRTRIRTGLHSRDEAETMVRPAQMIGPNGELLVDMPSMQQQQQQQQGSVQYPSPIMGHYPSIYPNLITAQDPIDEEVDRGERECNTPTLSLMELQSTPNMCDMEGKQELCEHIVDRVPSGFVVREMHQDSKEKACDAAPSHITIEMNDHGQSLSACQDRHRYVAPPSGISSAMNLCDRIQPRANSQLTGQVTPTPSDVLRFETTRRVGGIIICPSSQQAFPRAPIPSHLHEQMMHEGSWDSKYATYACRVDQSQEDRSVEIAIFSLSRPHMRSFHLAWFAFFLAFMTWFAITPLLSEVQKSLNLTKEEIWTSSIFSVSAAVVTRCVAGLLCDIYGGRWMSAVVLVLCGIPTMFTGLVNTSTGLSMLRLFTGIAGSAFITCQFWTCSMFTREVAGTANALAAGWGNLGGGVGQVLIGAMLFPLFRWIYTAAGTTMDPAEASWRTCCVIPGLLCIAFAFVLLRYSDDHPKGNYRKRKHLGLMQKASAIKHIKAAIRDHNTWLLFIQYGCCFGVELATMNAATLYFKENFELSTESAAAIASTFGWMNLFARGLGGFISDISNAYRGMRGRLIWQCICFALEGIFVMVFSKAGTLPGAIAALITFSLFVQCAEGSTFGIVPYLSPSVTGTVAGIIGAGGNVGAVIFSIFFRQMAYQYAFWWMGLTTCIVSLLSSLIWIKGYEGLFLKQRVKTAPAEMKASTPRKTDEASMLELPEGH